MKRLIAPLLMSLASLSHSAQPQKIEMLIWEPQRQDVKVDMSDLSRDPALTVYIPSKPNGTAVVMCPGGGYSHQASDHEGHAMAQWFNAMGVTYAVLKYRLPHGDPTVPVEDARQAIRLVRQNAADWGVDPHRIGIAGASAGGHLASSVATHPADSLSMPDFQILFYPVVSMDLAKTHRGSHDNMIGRDASEDLVHLYSNATQVTPSSPKAFVMLSADDKAVPPVNSLEYVQALIDNKVPVSLHMYPSGGHGWGFRDSFPYKPQWTAELDRWLRAL